MEQPKQDHIVTEKGSWMGTKGLQIANCFVSTKSFRKVYICVGKPFLVSGR